MSFSKKFRGNYEKNLWGQYVITKSSGVKAANNKSL